MILRLCWITFAVISLSTFLHATPALVEYPGHQATYGDHTFAATWVGGPVSTVSVEVDTDESILHTDGNGQSQRTARNTLTFTPPSAPDKPQNFDDLTLVAHYGSRYPQLQHMAADGTSTLTYRFPTAVDAGFDLHITDLDSSDAVVVRAFGLGGSLIDMLSWTLADEGDLSLYKDTGNEFSSIIAPTPNTVFSTQSIQLTAVNNTNYNRTYSILRAPIGTPVESVEIEFTGTHNSVNRDAGGTGSHVYLVLSALPDEPDFNSDGSVDGRDFLTWQRGFGQFAGNASREDGDANRDGLVDGADLPAWQIQYGITSTGELPLRAVPEPMTAAMLVAVLGGLVGKRKV